MESYWYEMKNLIFEMMKDVEHFNPALVPCRKAECDQWRGGECIQIRKAGKPERPQVFADELCSYSVGG